MDYGLNIYSAEERNNRLYEGPLQYCAHNSLLGWDVSAMGRGVAATKFSIWTQRGNYCLDTVSVVWDFAGKPNPD
jgi:hypothetical protein